MKHTRGTRLLSVLLTLAMLLSLMPSLSLTAFAATTYTSGTVDISQLKVGDAIGAGVQSLVAYEAEDGYSVTLVSNGFGYCLYDDYFQLVTTGSPSLSSNNFSGGNFLYADREYVPMYESESGGVQSDYWYVIAVDHEEHTMALSGDPSAKVYIEEIIGTEINYDITEDTIYNDDCTTTENGINNGVEIGDTYDENNRVIVTINGNLYVNKYLYLFSGSYIIVNGDLTFNRYSQLACYNNAKVIYTGTVTDNTDIGIISNYIVKPNISGNVTYHAASGDDPEYFTFGTSDTKYFFNGSEFLPAASAEDGPLVGTVIKVGDTLTLDGDYIEVMPGINDQVTDSLKLERMEYDDYFNAWGAVFEEAYAFLIAGDGTPEPDGFYISGGNGTQSHPYTLALHYASAEPETPSAYADLKNTTTVITFDNKQWYLIEDNSTSATEGTVTLLSKECVGASIFGGSSTYSGSTVEGVVNNYYTNSISTDAKTVVSGNGMFLLTIDQANAIKTANVDVLKCSKATGAESILWWLGSPCDPYNAACVYGDDRSIRDSGEYVERTLGVRPALQLDLSKVEFDSETNTFALPTPAHTHNFTYAADGATLTATCSAEGCTLDDGTEQHNHAAFLILNAPEGTLTYDSNAKPATVTFSDNFESLLSVFFDDPEITLDTIRVNVHYYKNGDKTAEPSEDAIADAGTHITELGFKGQTASVSYTIAKADPTYTVPTGLTATYGQTLADVTLPTGWSWNDATTTSVGNAGSHTFKANFTPEDTANYNTVNNIDVTVTVAKKEITVSGIKANNKVYDGNYNATIDTSLATISGALSGDTLTVSADASFSDKNVAEDKTVYLSNITLGGESASNYTLASSGQQETTTASITAKGVTISGITANSKVYDGTTAATINYTSATIQGMVSGDDLSIYTDFASSHFADKNVGNNKTVTISYLLLTGSDAANYTVGSVTVTANITAKEVGLEWSNTELTYNGKAQKPTATATGLAGQDTCTVTVVGEQTNAGDNYTATAQSLSNSNYKLPENKTTAFKINKASQTAPAAPTKADATVDSITLTAITNGEYKCGAGDWQTSPTFTGLAQNTSYTFRQRYAADANHNASAGSDETVIRTNNHSHEWSFSATGATITATCTGTGTCSLTNNQISVTLVAPEGNPDLIYNGSDHAATLDGAEAFNAATGMNVSAADIVYNYKATSSESAAVVTETKNAGIYQALYTLQTPTSPKPFVGISFTVNKADPTATAPTATATYGQTLADVTLTNPTGNTAGTWAWAVDTATEVGSAGSNTFTANFTPTDTANYNSVSGVNVTVTVGKATPTYTVPTGLTATYGDLLSTVALPTGWAWTNGEQTVGNAGSNTFTATFTPTDTDNYNTVENVNVTVTVGKATPTYTVPTGLTATYGDLLSSVTLPTGWAWTNGAQSVGNAGSNTFTATFTPMDTDNYNTVENVNVTVTVAPASVTLTANSGTETYDTTEKTVEGFTASVDGLTFTDVTASGSGTNAGEYNVTFSGVALNETKDSTGNYIVTATTDGKLTINPAEVTLTANSDTETYDTTEKTVEGFTCSVDGLTFTDVTAFGSGTNAGEHNVTFTGVTLNETKDSTGNYVVTATTDGKLTIGKAPFTIKALDQTMYVNGKLPDLGNPERDVHYTVSGLIGEDTLSVTPTLTYQKDNEAAEPETDKTGTYDIVPSGAVADNYEIAYESGTLTIKHHSSSGSMSITVPVSGDNETVNVKIEVKNNSATVKEADVDKVLEAEKVGTVTIDASIVQKNVNEVLIPGAMVDKIADAVADKKNDADSMEVKLPSGSVTFDADAVAAISEKTDGKDLTLHLDDVKVTELNTAQQNATRELEVEAVLDAYLTSGGQRISDFKGGTATVSVPYALKGDQSEDGLAVWYVADNGTKSSVPSSYKDGKVFFVVWHFSNYVIAYDSEKATCPMNAFSDLDSTLWYHDGIHYCLENGMMNGVGNGKFNPSGTTSRAMIVTILYRLENTPAVTTANPFTDVEAGKWYTDAVIWASENKIVEGYGNGKFGPDDDITREQLAAILYRYAQYKGQGFTGGWMFLLDYPDAPAVSSWADEAMHWCVMNGIINGKDGKLVPKGDALRSEAAAMIQRFCTKTK